MRKKRLHSNSKKPTKVMFLIESLPHTFEDSWKELPLEQLVKQLDILRSTVERTIMKYFKRTPKAEMLRIQIEHTKTFLKQTFLSIPIVAAFSQYVSTSPARFGKQKTI